MVKEIQYDEVAVIGAGQAGLAMGYYLKRLGVTFAALDAQARVGDTWRKRYDSLALFTPRRYSGLPGMSVPGDQGGYPTKDEIADYLEDYAAAFEIPVLLGTAVERLERTGRADKDLYQGHTSAYLNPQHLLVV